jgi:hypothetical protein
MTIHGKNIVIILLNFLKIAFIRVRWGRHHFPDRLCSPRPHTYRCKMSISLAFRVNLVLYWATMRPMALVTTSITFSDQLGFRACLVCFHVFCILTEFIGSLRVYNSAEFFGFSFLKLQSMLPVERFHLTSSHISATMDVLESLDQLNHGMNCVRKCMLMVDFTHLSHEKLQIKAKHFN